jgi:2-dehydro-3-deoxygalactonokinase
VTASRLLACDWGTTHLRAWVLEEGHVTRRRKFPFGVSRIGPGEAERTFRLQVRPAMDAEHLPALLCGMIGSTLGWTAVPYLSCPANLADVAAGMTQVEQDPPAWIVPGLLAQGIDKAPDVMRGEETQILGWSVAQAGDTCDEHVICHPGTHSKWVLVVGGSIVRFVTAMTGELFELLRKHSVLQAPPLPDDDGSFDDGVIAAGDGNALAARLFTTRARTVTGNGPRSPECYLSGVLIGAEVASVPSMLGVDRAPHVTLIGDRELCRLYKRVLARAGTKPSFVDGEDAALAGLVALSKRMPVQ